jgi:putative transposase
MKRIRFTEEQIIGVLCEQEAGMNVAEVCRRHGISQPTFDAWKAKFGGMSVSDAKRLKQLEEENAPRTFRHHPETDSERERRSKPNRGAAMEVGCEMAHPPADQR